MDVGIILVEQLEKGILKKESRERIKVGKRLLDGGLVGSLILSGGVRKRPGYKELIGDYESCAQIMQKYARSIGVNDSKTILEDISEDTVGQLIFVKEGILDPKKITKGIIVTHSYHMPRVMEEVGLIFGDSYEFSYFGIKNKDKKKMKIERTGNSLEAFYKTFEGVDFTQKEQVLNALLSNHPLYNHAPNFYRRELEKLKTKHQK